MSMINGKFGLHDLNNWRVFVPPSAAASLPYRY